MLKLGITGKNELVGVKFNFGAYSLIFACYAPGLFGFRGIFLKLCLLSPAKS